MARAALLLHKAKPRSAPLRFNHILQQLQREHFTTPTERPEREVFPRAQTFPEHGRGAEAEPTTEPPPPAPSLWPDFEWQLWRDVQITPWSQSWPCSLPRWRTSLSSPRPAPNQTTSSAKTLTTLAPPRQHLPCSLLPIPPKQPPRRHLAFFMLHFDLWR